MPRINYPALKTILDGSHPDATLYSSLDDAACLAKFTELNRPASADKSAILQYLLLERYDTNNGNDTQPAYLYGRIAMVAQAAVGSDVFEQGGGTPPALTMRQKMSALTLLRIVGPDSGFALDLLDSRFDSMLTHMQGADAIAPADKTALQALSQNKASHAMEVAEQINYSGRITLSHIQHARSLP